MIILKLLTMILLVPLTIITLVLFNIYMKHWLYLFLVASFGLIYALCMSFVFLAPGATVWFFIFLTFLYVMRMRHLGKQLRTKKNYTLLRGEINLSRPKISLIFFFPLYFLNMLKHLPAAAHKKMLEKTGCELSQLVDVILIDSKGTKVEVANEKVRFYFEITT